MENQVVEKKLVNGMVARSTCKGKMYLSAKFQIWASNYGLTDSESLAVWIADDDERKEFYFRNKIEAEQEAENGLKKLEGVEIPNLTDAKRNMFQS